MPHVFKNKILVFQVMVLTKRQKKNSLSEFCYGLNKAFEFLFSLDLLPPTSLPHASHILCPYEDMGCQHHTKTGSLNLL
jgi:hypothetical protein